MPIKIPDVDQSAIRVPNAPTNAPIEAFGGGASTEAVGRAAQDLQKQTTDFFIQQKRQADDAAVQEAYYKTVQQKNTLLYTGDNAAMKKQGKDAFALPDTHGAEFNKFTQDVEDNLGNEDQKAFYRKIKRAQQSEFDSSLSRHVATEGEKFKVATYKNALVTTQEDAVMNYQEPGAMDRSIDRQKALIAQFAQDNGMPIEEIDRQMKDAESKTYVGVIERVMAGGDDLLAKKMYDDGVVNNRITGEDQTKLAKAMELSSSRSESYRISDQILKEYPTRGAAMEAVSSTEDPETRKMAEANIRQHFDDVNNDLKVTDERLYRKAFHAVEANPGKPVHEVVSPADLARMNPDDIVKLKKVNKNTQTNWTLYYELRDKATDPATRANFADEFLLKYKGDLADTEFKELVKLQDSVKKGDDKAFDGVNTKNGIINNTLILNKINPQSKDKTEKQKVAEFRRYVDEQQRSFQEQTGKKATSKDIQQIVDEALVVRRTEPGFFGTSIGKKEYRAFESNAKTAKDVPPEDRQKIEAALRKANRQINDQAIINLYNKKMNGR